MWQRVFINEANLTCHIAPLHLPVPHCHHTESAVRLGVPGSYPGQARTEEDPCHFPAPWTELNTRWVWNIHIRLKDLILFQVITSWALYMVSICSGWFQFEKK